MKILLKWYIYRDIMCICAIPTISFGISTIILCSWVCGVCRIHIVFKLNNYFVIKDHDFDSCLYYDVLQVMPDWFFSVWREVDRLKRALALLSEAEKHLRLSSERSTWFTATLLQLGSMPSPDQNHSGSSRRQISKETEEDGISILNQKQRTDDQFLANKSASPSSISFVIPTA